MSIQILSTGSCQPENVVTNQHLTSFLDTNDEWISSRTGIRERRLCSSEDLTQLAATAAARALEQSGIGPEELDYILCATMQGDFVTPSLACMVQQQLGAHCPALDFNAACSGFLYGLEMADAYISAGKAKTVLLVAAEQMSKLVDWQDRATCVLFGDGAGAAVLTAGEALNYIHATAQGRYEPLYIDGNQGNSPFRIWDERPRSHSVQMDGQEIFKFAVTTAGREIKQALAACSLTADQIDHYLLHQANLRIIESVRTRLGQPAEKFPVSIDHTGNCSSASVIMLLDALNRGGKLKKGDRLLLTAFGAGLTTGTAIVTWGL